MGRVVPFRRNDNPQEETILQKLQDTPDDLGLLGELLNLKICQGRFSSKSFYAKQILQSLANSDISTINNFLVNLFPQIEWLDWGEIDDSESHKKFKQSIDELRNSKQALELAEIMKDGDPTQKMISRIYDDFFKEDGFVDIFQSLVPPHSVRDLPLMNERVRSDKQLMLYLIDCFTVIISAVGSIEGLAFIRLFSIHNNIGKLISEPKLTYANKDLLALVESLLSARFVEGTLSFINLYRLFALRFELALPLDDVCNAIIAKVSDTPVDEIYDAFTIEFIYTTKSGVERWADTHQDIETGFITVDYERSSDGESANFIEDLYLALDARRKYHMFISSQACRYWDFDIDCPLGHLVCGMNAYLHDFRDFIQLDNLLKGLFSTGKLLFTKGSYIEAQSCYKLALFHTLFPYDATDSVLESLKMNLFSESVRKLKNYDENLSFLSKFIQIAEQGFPVPQGIINEIVIAKKELEYENETRTYYKISEFYEIVAKEDFQAVQTYITGQRGQIVLTKEQLRVLIQKIQEKTEIIRGIKSINAKCDMMMYMQHEVNNKQVTIFEAIKDSSTSIENLINKNTDKIIENLHKKNEQYLSQVNTSLCEEYYHGQFGKRLWNKLDEGTRKYLLLGHHLDASNQYSPVEEFGFIAIEYGLAIENEFKSKIINGYLSKGERLVYRMADKPKSITEDTKITLGTICSLIDQTRKTNSKSDPLWLFKSFLLANTDGKKDIFDFKNALFDVKDKYRNPAAHPSNYTRDIFESFKKMLFEDGFMKKYMSAIQLN